MKKLLALLIISPFTYSNPTSGWQDSLSDSGGWFFLLGAWVFILVVGGFLNLKDKFTKPEIKLDTSKDEESVFTEEEPKEKDIYVDTYKKHAKEFVKEPYVRENKNMQMNTGSREPFYMVTILALLIIMFVQYTKYREDSFSRITQCFADEVPDSEQDFCESFYEEYRDPKITLSEAEKVITDCWDERIMYCKEEALGDECTFRAFEYCAVKHPEHWKIMEDKEKTFLASQKEGLKKDCCKFRILKEHYH